MTLKSSSKTRIYAIFFLSGISGLIYETVWLRILIRVLGSTVYATSIVLASFMAGMAVGSYVLGRYAQGAKSQLRLFSYLQLGIGASALALTFSLKGLGPLYRAVYPFVGQERFALILFQSAVMFFLLLIPSSFMGGTLPVLASHTRKYHARFSERLGHLYGLNALGACVGVIGSGIYAIGALGETNTLIIGVLINLFVALAALSLSKGEESGRSIDAKEGLVQAESETISPYDDATRKKVLAAYALSGFAAMAYEIVWTRLFQIQVGTSIYAFSLMLAFYLLGVALGSIAATRFLPKIKNPLMLFGASQLFIAFYSILGMYLFTLFQPALIAGFFNFKNMLLLPAVIIFPITFVLGFIFPAVSESYVKDEGRTSSGVGRIYAFNTLGCIFGSLVSGFVLIGLLGTKGTILVLSGVNMLIGIIILSKAPSGIKKYCLNSGLAVFLITLFVFGLFSPDPFKSSLQKLVRFLSGKYGQEVEVYYHREAVAATTTVLGAKGQPLSRNLWINGIGMTSLCLETKLMAHLPILLHGNPQNILTICFGMGTTLRSAWLHRSLRCDVVELVPQVYACFKYFHQDASAILADPRVRHFTDDGRNFLLVRGEKYDIITMDPSPPIWSAGTVNLYSKEFLQLAKDHLNPDGLMCLWIPPSSFSEILMIMKTFQTVFPNTLVFRGVKYPGLYLIGFKNKEAYRLENFARLAQDQKELILKDLNEWGDVFLNIESILNLFMLNAEELRAFVEGERIITDDRPYTEFPLFRSLFDDTFRMTLDGNLLSVLKKRMFEK